MTSVSEYDFIEYVKKNLFGNDWCLFYNIQKVRETHKGHKELQKDLKETTKRCKMTTNNDVLFYQTTFKCKKLPICTSSLPLSKLAYCLLPGVIS